MRFADVELHRVAHTKLGKLVQRLTYWGTSLNLFSYSKNFYLVKSWDPRAGKG